MKRFGLLGRTLVHSYSPKIHGLLGDYPYDLFAIEPSEISNLLAQPDLGGLNVTIPYKQTVLPYCTTLSDQARRIGCVNTLLFQEGGLYGDNTDYDGFAGTVDVLNVDLTGKHVVILGRGATAQTVRTVCQDKGAKTIRQIGRRDLPLDASTGLDAHLLVNCTPVGMYPHNGETLVALRNFLNLEAVIDVVYNPHRTALLLEAKELGIPYADGLPMLVGQAIRAAELFTGTKIRQEESTRILKTIRRETENIVLIGMPGSGKSTMGQALALALDRPFIDTDVEITKEIGVSIPEFFKMAGEPSFRAVETKIIQKFGKENGLVIATGGGIVKDPQNYSPLAQNGRIYCLDRPLEDLATKDRPLSGGGANLHELFVERDPLYRKFADVIVKNESVTQTVAAILEEFNENCHY